MAAYTAKFNAQEGKSLARDEFRFVSNGATVGGGDRVEDLPAKDAPHGGGEARARRAAPPATTTTTTTTLTPHDAFGCGGVSCQAGRRRGRGLRRRVIPLCPST